MSMSIIDSKKEGDAYDKDTKQPSTGRRDPQGRDRKEKIPTDGNERVSKKPLVVCVWLNLLVFMLTFLISLLDIDFWMNIFYLQRK